MNRMLVGRSLMVLGALLMVTGVVGVVTGDDGSAAPTVAPSTTAGSSSTVPVTTVPAATVPATTVPVTTVPVTTVPVTTVPASTVPATTVATPTVAPSTTAAAAGETPEAFFAVLLEAFAGGDATTLYDRMNRATLDRYGTAQCEAYAAAIAGAAQDLVLLGTTAVAEWDYVTDAVSTVMVDVVAVDVERTLNGETVAQQLHWQLVDGRFTWFTDCGDPV